MTRRFHTLDGMRGVAALAVTIGHYAHWFQPLSPPHGWLAVDLFFIMSGVVISRVYEPRFQSGMSTAAFMLQRYIRFYPLFILGVLIGTASEFSTIISGHGAMSWTALAESFVTASAMLPSPTWQFKPSLMPLNDPGWSLFFEIFVNLVFVVFWRFWNRITLCAVIIASGVVMFLHFLITGEGFGGSTWATFFWGFPRVSFSFFLGVSIARYNVGKVFHSHWAWLPLLLLIPILFFDHDRPAYVDVVMQLILLPILVFSATCVEPRSISRMQWLGKISYPLYAIHLPILFFLWRILLALHLRPEIFAPFSGIGVLVSVVILASWLDRHYDQPVRNWLMKRIPFAKPNGAIEQAGAL